MWHDVSYIPIKRDIVHTMAQPFIQRIIDLREKDNERKISLNHHRKCLVSKKQMSFIFNRFFFTGKIFGYWLYTERRKDG